MNSFVDQIPERLVYASVATLLELTKTRRELLAAAENIQHVESIQQREELGAIVKKRLAEFKAAE